MDLSNANYDVTADMTSHMANLQAQDAMTRQYLADAATRKAEAAQNTQYDAGPDTNRPTAATVNVAAGATPASGANGAGGPAAAPYNTYTNSPTLAGPNDPYKGVPADPSAGIPPPNPNGPWAGRTNQSVADQIAQEQATQDNLRQMRLRASPMGGGPQGSGLEDIQRQLDESQARLAALKAGKLPASGTQAANPAFVPNGAPSTPPSDTSTGSDNSPQANARRASSDVEELQRELARVKGNTPAANDQRQILQAELAKAQQAGGQAGQAAQSQPQDQQGASAAPAPAPQPATPTGPGQTYSPPAGASDFNFDNIAANSRLQQIQQRFKILQSQQQNAATGAERSAATAEMNQLQTEGQQLHAGIFSNNMMQGVRQVESGNLGALGEMIQAYAQNTHTPLVIHQVGQGQYALYTPQGQPVTQPGSAVDLARSLYGKVAPDGRKMLAQNAMMFQQAYQTAFAKAIAEADPAQKLELLKGEEAVRLELAKGNNERALELTRQIGFEASRDPLTGQLTLYRKTGANVTQIPQQPVGGGGVPNYTGHEVIMPGPGLSNVPK